jgi:hypothetical protein
MGDNGLNGFDRLMWVDDQIIAAHNFTKRLKFTLSGYKKKHNLERNKELKNKHLGQRCFIVGNGPSIKQQDLTLLANEWTFCVNHFYRHPQIEDIKPKYYTIIDPKLITGEWPVSMLDEIIEKCPQAKFFLSSQYQDIPQISAYSEFAAIYMGFQDIYLLGIDCDGIFRDLVEQSSHFYEAKKENIGDNDPLLVVRHLRSTIQGLRGWGVIADKFKNSPHNITNLTRGGLLNVFPREEFENVVLNKKLSFK